MIALFGQGRLVGVLVVRPVAGRLVGNDAPKPEHITRSVRGVGVFVELAFVFALVHSP